MTYVAPIASEPVAEEARAPDEAARALATSPERFFNRELSWLSFNRRVLAESKNPRHPLLERLNAEAADLMADQQRRWRQLCGELADEGLRLVTPSEVSDREKEALEEVFANQLFPVLTPLAIDPAHPFPFIPNLAFSLVLKLKRTSDGRLLYALVPIPAQVARFWELPRTNRRRAERRFVSLEGMVTLFLDQIFPGYEVEGQGVFRLIRDS